MQFCLMKLGYTEHTGSHDSWIPLRGVVNSFERRRRSAHNCSMGFKSRDCVGHWRSWNGCDANRSCTILLVCVGSLSYWKTKLLGPRLWFCIVDHKTCCKIHSYGCMSILPSTLYHVPTQKLSCILKSSPAHYRASQPNGHVEVQHVLHLQSNTMTYHMSWT